MHEIIPEGESPLRAGVTPRTVSKWQDFGVSSVERWFSVRGAVKEANRQTPVLTNRNGIRGCKAWISKHIIATSEN